MRVFTGILTIILPMCLLLTGMQVPIPHQITYDPAYKLKWADFYGKVPASTPLSATSTCGISMDMSSQDNKMLFTVISFFKKNESWVLEKSKGNMELLKHEQCHFDLYELHAREFRKTLAGLKMKLNDIAKTLPELYNKATAACKEENAKYDKETNHSIDEVAQKKWNAAIEARLKASFQWKDTKVTVIPVP